MVKTGRVDCQCGDQIISNSGKTISKSVGMISCWDPECGIVYDSETLEKARKEGEVVVFESPGKDLKVFKMNECDWWMDKNLNEAEENYPKFIGDNRDDCIENPYELTVEQLKKYDFYSDGDFIRTCSFIEELQRKQSISDKPDFFASTEY